MPWICWPLIRRTTAAHGTVKHSVGAVHHVRHARHVRRIAAIVCVSVGGFGSAVLIPPLVYAPPVPSMNERAAGHIDLAARAPQPIPEPSSLALLLPAAVVAIAIGKGRRA